jgi:hypothetical protein
MSEEFRLLTFMRRGSSGRMGSRAQVRYCNLGPQQPLLLHREPSNPYDSNAVSVTDILNQHVGYVAREHAGIVSAKIEQGVLLLCRTNGECGCATREILIWSEGLAAEKEEKKSKSKPKAKSSKPINA